MKFNMIKSPYDFYGVSCYQDFKERFPVGTLLVPRERLWILMPGITSKELDWEGSKEVDKGSTSFLVLDHWLDFEYGTFVLDVKNNQKVRITSSWVLKAMDVTLPDPI